MEAITTRYHCAHIILGAWEVEWDAQPFRISAVPPRTIGMMLHQLVTANYYHMTLRPGARVLLLLCLLVAWGVTSMPWPGWPPRSFRDPPPCCEQLLACAGRPSRAQTERGVQIHE